MKWNSEVGIVDNRHPRAQLHDRPDWPFWRQRGDVSAARPRALACPRDQGTT
jgi:hypothetical protein